LGINHCKFTVFSAVNSRVLWFFNCEQHEFVKKTIPPPNIHSGAQPVKCCKPGETNGLLANKVPGIVAYLPFATTARANISGGKVWSALPW